MRVIRRKMFGFGAVTTLALAASVMAFAQDDPDQVTDGEQRVNISGRLTAEQLTVARRALSRVDGVQEVSGQREVIFRPAAGSALAWSAVQRAVDAGHDSPIVGAPTLGFALTVDVVFKPEQVPADRVQAVIDAMPTFDTLAEVTYVSGTTIRLRSAPWSPRNQRGFNVTSLLSPAARATGYRGPGAPSYDRFIQDVTFEPGGT